MQKILAIALFVGFALAVPNDVEAANKVCSEMEFTRSGEIRGTARSVGFIIGVR